MKCSLSVSQTTFFRTLGVLLFNAALLGGAPTTRAQAPAWAQAVGVQTTQAIAFSYSHVNDIAVDADGNRYLVGYFLGIATFGAITLTSASTRDAVYVAKLDTAGVFQWATQVECTAYNTITGVAVVGSGPTAEVYVTGSFNDDAMFGATTLTSASVGARDVFVAKLNALGAFQWAVRAGGAGSNDLGEGICLTGTGATTEVYITGTLSDTASFGTTTLISTGDADVFVAKLNAAGTFQWATQAGGIGIEEDVSIAVAGSASTADIYVTGSFESNAAFGATTLASAGQNDVFVTKLNAAGAFEWAVRAGGIYLDRCHSVAVTGSGTAAEVYATGFLSGTANFGANTLTSAGFSDVFVTKLNAAGVFEWASRAGSSNNNETSEDVALMGSGATAEVYITGSFNGTTTFGATTLSCAGYSDVFVSKLDGTGAYQWATRAGGNSTLTHEAGTSLAVVGSGAAAEVSVGGFYADSASFGFFALTNNNDPVSGFNVAGFVARLGGQSPTGTAPDELQASLLTLWPNPAVSGLVRLTRPAGAVPALVDVLDALGRRVRRAPVDADGALDVRGLTPGVYTVRVGAATARLVLD